MTDEKQKIQTPEMSSHVSDAEKIASLNVLQTSSGWMLILEQLMANQKYLEKAILDRIDPYTKKVMTEDEVEDARNKRGLLIELMKTPQKLIEYIETTDREEPIDFDPYEKNPEAL